jgi:pimeloyl-ACP methyl ester carboxylesterase
MQSKQQGRLLLHYETHLLDPKAEWVVFIHGAGGSIVTWKYQVDAFKPFFQFVVA